MRFFLERWVLKGVLHQLLLMAALVVTVALLGGLVAWAFTSSFATPGEAIWWAFLRLTDPGYLGDDEGLVLRVVSTTVTILGYVLFMGSLIAILTQWLAKTLRRLESGLTPIRMKGHVIVLGWTNRTPEVVLRLLTARGRLKRFLARSNVQKLRIVVLTEDVGVERRQELRDHLGPYWKESQVFLRSGSSLHPEHLQRLALAHASTVIVPGADFALGGSDSSDTRVVKTLLSMNEILRDRGLETAPSIVGEVFDPLKIGLAQGANEQQIEVIASDRVISRLISQSIRHRGLAQVLFRILSHRQGNSLYLRHVPGVAGSRPRDLFDHFPRAVLLGFVRADGAARTVDLQPLTDATLRADDLLVFLAETYDDCAPLPGKPAPTGPLDAAPVDGGAAKGDDALAENHRVLVLGWSHKIGALAAELGASASGRFELTLMSRVDVAERERWMRRVDCAEGNIRIRHVPGDYALESDLAAVRPETFDNVLFLASDWMSSSQDADARTVLGYVLLRSMLKRVSRPPELLIELLDPDNERLFQEDRDIYLVTPRVLSYLLAHVALRPELSSVFEELFGAGGSEIDLDSTRRHGLDGRTVTFPEIQRATLQRGVLALGILTESGTIRLNPPRSEPLSLGADDHVVVLTSGSADPR